MYSSHLSLKIKNLLWNVPFPKKFQNTVVTVRRGIIENENLSEYPKTTPLLKKWGIDVDWKDNEELKVPRKF